MTRDEFRSAVEDILGVPPGSLHESDSRSTIDSWSSIADVQIAAYISSEGGVEPDAELLEAETFGDLCQILDDKSAFAG